MSENSQYYGRPNITSEYANGYQQAIEDMTKCKDALCHSCKQYDREHYKCPIWCKVISGTVDEIKYQARANAIDECIKFLKSHTTRAFIDSDGWGCTDNDRDDIIMAYWLDDLEQIKEQKND